MDLKARHDGTLFTLPSVLMMVKKIKFVSFSFYSCVEQFTDRSEPRGIAMMDH